MVALGGIPIVQFADLRSPPPVGESRGIDHMTTRDPRSRVPLRPSDPQGAGREPTQSLSIERHYDDDDDDDNDDDDDCLDTLCGRVVVVTKVKGVVVFAKFWKEGKLEPLVSSCHH